MVTRRTFLSGGLGALAGGVLVRPGLWRQAIGPCLPSDVLPLSATHPLLRVPLKPRSTVVAGLPFAPWFSGDEFENPAIPFHSSPAIDELPVPAEHVNVAIVGGGISGLATAYLLREHRPVVLELRDRFGGNAMGETWASIPYSLASAYVITPDAGSFLESFYAQLGLDRLRRESLPPDPIELAGRIRDDFWSGGGQAPAEQQALVRYAEVVRRMAEEDYPEIPLPDDPREVERIRALDRRTFRQDLEQQMGLSLTPLLAAALQGYCYSSFGAGIDEISAASGWNFVAAEEYGRWVFPGGNAELVRALWERLRALETERCTPRLLRCRSQVVDVRPRLDSVLLTVVGADGRLRSLTARHAVMAGSKHIVKHVLHDLERRDPERLLSMNQISSYAYLVVNVLLDAPIERDFYDCFLVGDETFPMTPGAVEAERPVVDVLRGDYALAHPRPRSVLTLYWPLPWPSSRFTLLLEDPWRTYAERLAPQLRAILALLAVPETSVRQVRMSRWGHAMPIAKPGFIADGHADRVRRTLGENIHFVNQDNWALPAVENSLLDARTVAEHIAQRLQAEARRAARR